ncbi:MAG: glycosyltransferase family 2 protein [Planctomycetales bacterium]|nr:glycosyltransferase family 2 protein [Planctomycetales bacterium]
MLISDQQVPKAAVILCLRGGDPFLADCLAGLLGQDYPDFDIRVIIDHEGDPTHPIVQRAVEAAGATNVAVEVLQQKRPDCSLKCSSLLQVVQSLDDSYEFVAQLDADTIAHPTWLRELATALQDEQVGAATGNRWYMPGKPSVGALVRYTWNAAAIVQMYWYHVAWGGTLAVKTRVFRETDVLEKWGQAFCEDTMLFGVLKRVGLRVAFVPSLMMINRESCDLGGFFRWVRRQLLTARLYHPAWPAVIGHGIWSTLLPLAALVGFVAALATGNPQAATWAGAALLLYEVSVAVLLVPMELAVQKIADSRGEPSKWLPLLGKLKCLAIMPVTQVVYAAALASSLTLRSTVWRGISYRVNGPWQIEMQEYRPYCAEQPTEQTVSL